MTADSPARAVLRSKLPSLIIGGFKFRLCSVGFDSLTVELDGLLPMETLSATEYFDLRSLSVKILSCRWLIVSSALQHLVLHVGNTMQ